MSKTQQIVDTIAAERDSGFSDSEAELLRWSVWLLWEQFGSDVHTDPVPQGMTSTEWADACETIGIKRGTAMNRYSEARRNWEGMFG